MEKALCAIRSRRKSHLKHLAITTEDQLDLIGLILGIAETDFNFGRTGKSISIRNYNVVEYTYAHA